MYRGEEYLKSKGAPVTVLYDEGSHISDKLGASSVPTIYLLARDGVVLYEGQLDAVDLWNTIHKAAARNAGAEIGLPPPPRPDEAVAATPSLGNVSQLEATQRRHLEVVVELGQLYGYVTGLEVELRGGICHAVWRRVEKGTPTHVFQIPASGAPTDALTQLQVAVTVWGAKPYLLVPPIHEAVCRRAAIAEFAELADVLTLVPPGNVEELMRLKRRIIDLARPFK